MNLGKFDFRDNARKLSIGAAVLATSFIVYNSLRDLKPLEVVESGYLPDSSLVQIVREDVRFDLDREYMAIFPYNSNLGAAFPMPLGGYEASVSLIDSVDTTGVE